MKLLKFVTSCFFCVILSSCDDYWTNLNNTHSKEFAKSEWQSKYRTSFCSYEKECYSNRVFIYGNTGFDVESQQLYGNTNSIYLQSFSMRSVVQTPINTFSTESSSGVIMLPLSKHGQEPVKIKGVVLYFHPTTFDKTDVPSKSYYVAGKHDQDYTYMALYASQGYVVIAPDYIGLGDDHSNIHPYVLYPRQNVSTAFQMLDNAESLIRTTYSIESNTKIKLFSAGYSEGAGYSIWFSKCAQRQHGRDCGSGISNLLSSGYEYIASSGMDGAYDLESVIKPFLLKEAQKDKDNEFNIEDVRLTDMAKPGLTTLAMMAYLKYDLGYKDTSQYESAFNHKFYHMDCIIEKSKCKYKDLLNAVLESNTDISQPLFLSAFGKALTVASGKKYHYLEVDGIIHEGKNSIYSFVREDYIKGLDSRFKDASIVDFGRNTTKPLYIFTLERDSVVSPNNAINFNKYAVGNSNVHFESIDNNSIKVLDIINDTNLKAVPLDHIHGEIYANIYTLNFFNKCILDNGLCKPPYKP